jgi:hypothetical protein
MKRLAKFLHKYRWPLLISIVLPVSLLIFFFRHMSKFADSLAAKTYTEYVKHFYLPEQRRKTGKWPANLDGLPRENPAGHDGMTEHALLFHTRLFQSFEPLQATPRKYSYILHLQNYDVKCTSCLREKETDAESCTYTEE